MLSHNINILVNETTMNLKQKTKKPQKYTNDQIQINKKPFDCTENKTIWANA